MANLQTQSAVLSSGAFDFSWQLSGDKAVAPIQVFNHSHQVWLQFAPNQHLPAIFAIKNGNLHAVSYQHYDPYVIIEGNWQHLLFQGGRLRAYARHLSVSSAEGTAIENNVNNQPRLSKKQAKTSLFDSDAKKNTKKRIKKENILTQRNNTTKNKGVKNSLKTQNNSSLTVKKKNTAVHLGELKQIATIPLDEEKKHISEKVKKQEKERQQKRFNLNPADETLRQGLKRWARQVDWHFGDEHWGLAVDYPIVSHAEFIGSFPEAVEQVLNSVRLGGMPIRACFYSNRVLRVIAEAQSCQIAPQD